MEKISKHRLIAYFLFIGAFIVCLGVFYFYQSLNEVEKLERFVESVRLGALTKQSKQVANLVVIEHFRQSDRFYIDKYLETLTFLEPEIEALQKGETASLLPVNDALKKRQEFLIGAGNRLIFSEGVIQKHPQYQEVIETQTHPIEVNVEDIKQILAKVEGVEIGTFAPAPFRPQLIVLDFKLDKKSAFEGTEEFVLMMKLLKREYQ